MNYKLLFIFLILIIGKESFALIEFNNGDYLAEGKIVSQHNELYFCINYNADVKLIDHSQTCFKFNEHEKKKYTNQIGSNAKCLIKIRTKVPLLSSFITPESIELKNWISPDIIIKKYHSLSDF